MASAMNKLMSEIHFQIPREILNLAFKNTNYYNNTVNGIDDTIMTNVIRKRLMVDLNLSSQETLVVELANCELLFHDTVKTAFHIPKSLTDGRSIVSVLSMLSGYHMHGDSMLTNHQLTGSSVLDNSINLMNSLDNVNIRQTARIDLIGENTILIDQGMLDNLAINVSVIVENEDNLNNINPRAFGKLAHLAVLVTKAYIYNSMVVQINKGVLYNGHELGIIKDIVDEYKDAEEAYREYYDTVWKKVAFMQNEKSMDKFITSMFGSVV